MSKAAKRQRQKERKAERQRIEANLARRRKFIKFGVYIGVVAVIVAGTLIVLRVSQGSENKAAKDCAPTEPVPAGSPALQIDPKAKYTATIETTEGTMVAELDACTQVWGANNFVSLARKGFYDGLTFHRAAKDFVIQGGDPKGDGSGGPGYEFISELPAKGYAVGDLAWAKAGQAPPGSTGSQFFVITSDAALTTFNREPYLYGQFGKLTSGLDVAQKINGFAPESGDGKPTTEVKITKVTIDGPVVEPSTTTTAPPAPSAPASSAP